ncbi:MAG: phosphatase PAP2 family protein [Saccharofermentanales bacterium]
MMVWNDYAWRKELLKKILVVSLFFIAGYLYYLVNLYNDIRFADTKPFIFIFPIDKYIPFSRFSAIPYYYWYLYTAATLLIMFFQRESKSYYRLIFSMFTGVLISCAIYIVFPTYVPRIELTGDDILTNMIRRIYTIDPPYNCFPSMHVLYSFICFWYLAIFRRVGWWFDLLNGMSFILITLSTVYSKQHYTPDILGGIAVGATVCAVFTFVIIRNRKKPVIL